MSCSQTPEGTLVGGSLNTSSPVGTGQEWQDTEPKLGLGLIGLKLCPLGTAGPQFQGPSKFMS